MPYSLGCGVSCDSSDMLAVKAQDAMNELCLSIMHLSVHVAACMLHNSGCNVLCNTLYLYCAWHCADYAAEAAYMGILLHSYKSHAVFGLHCAHQLWACSPYLLQQKVCGVF